MIIAYFAVSNNNIIFQYVFLCYFIIYYIQYISNPFIINENDIIEMILLICLGFIVSTRFASVIIIDHVVINIMISILIIIPIPILIYFIYKLYKKDIINNDLSNNDDALDDEKDDEIGYHYNGETDMETDDDNHDNVENSSIKALRSKSIKFEL